MKLQAIIGDDLLEVEVTSDGSHVVSEIDGRHYDLEVSEPEPNVFLFKNNGRITEAFVTRGGVAGEPQAVSIKGRQIEFQLIDPKRLRSSITGDTALQGLVEIRSAMPGKVVRVLLEPGAVVSKGDGVLVVEAMKMQNELKSPQAGTVKTIVVAEGDTITAGQILATIE